MGKLQLIVISITILCSGITAIAQDKSELVLQMSQPYSGGTARMLGIGGSKVALGADVGILHLNPASLGFYNRSEWVFTPSLNYIGTSSRYLGNTTPDNKLNFNFGNIGVVFNRSKRPHEEGKWRGGSLGFSLNRINNHHFDATYQAENTSDDIINYAVEQENYFQINDITDLLYSVGVTGEFAVPYTGQETIYINGADHRISDMPGVEVKNDSVYFTDRNIYDTETGELALPTEEFPVRQREEIRSRGSQYAASLSYGGNYDDKLYFGIGVNVMTIDKEVERIYTEKPTEADLSQLTFIDNYVLTGSGVNLNIGIIARPVQYILLGLSYTSPTYYNLEESQEFEMMAEYTGFSDQVDRIIHPSFDYNLTMPSKIRGGITYFVGKSGFISADVETSNTGNALFKSGYSAYDFSEDNNNIQRDFSRTIRAGIGGEYRMGIFRLRTGFSYISDPADLPDVDFERMMFALGAGLRKKSFFLDLSYNYLTGTQRVSPYPTAERVNIDKGTSMTSVSVGLNF